MAKVMSPENDDGGRLLTSAKSKYDSLPPPDTPVEMLIIKECDQQISRLSEHTVRQLVLQNKIPHIRTEQSKCGKILIPKSVLLDYLRSAA